MPKFETGVPFQENNLPEGTGRKGRGVDLSPEGTNADRDENDEILQLKQKEQEVMGRRGDGIQSKGHADIGIPKAFHPTDAGWEHIADPETGEDAIIDAIDYSKGAEGEEDGLSMEIEGDAVVARPSKNYPPELSILLRRMSLPRSEWESMSRSEQKAHMNRVQEAVNEYYLTHTSSGKRMPAQKEEPRGPKMVKRHHPAEHAGE